MLQKRPFDLQRRHVPTDFLAYCCNFTCRHFAELCSVKQAGRSHLARVSRLTNSEATFAQHSGPRHHKCSSGGRCGPHVPIGLQAFTLYADPKL